jgi:AraC family transcriptional regulator, regulatory protein of adaptative response / methylated-DNA-[protein]-cysteine methyltransferase
MHLDFATSACSLGFVLAARSRRGLCAILLGDDPDFLQHELRKKFPRATLTQAREDLGQVLAQVIDLLDSPGQGLNLPLDITGTPFQQRVWQVICAIPVGETMSYGEVAQRLGSPRATRAVAGACAANRLAVVIPCHRVLRRDGNLSGYRWGVERKRKLLAREGRSSISDGLAKKSRCTPDQHAIK